jgi:hypothetical protein
MTPPALSKYDQAGGIGIPLGILQLFPAVEQKPAAHP